MIGSGLKQLAAENGMRVSNGVAYGSLRGYAATLSEGNGYKAIVFSLAFPGDEQRDGLLNAANTADIKKQYRVQKMVVVPKAIQIIFQDNPGTMKKIREFLDWFIPLLGQYSATTADICLECGGQISVGSWKLIDGIAFHLHDSCAEKLRGQVAASNETRREEAQGSYGMGLLGALLGAAIGAVLWALVLNLGYVAALVGLVIGWLAEKGYTLLHGKQGKGKVAILIVAILVGVALGTIGADVFTLVSMINSGEAPLTYGDIPEFLLYMLQTDSEYVTATLTNLGMGVVFAGLGVYGILKKTGKEVADTAFVDLK